MDLLHPTMHAQAICCNEFEVRAQLKPLQFQGEGAESINRQVPSFHDRRWFGRFAHSWTKRLRCFDDQVEYMDTAYLDPVFVRH